MKISVKGMIWLMPWNAATWQDLQEDEHEAIQDYISLNNFTFDPEYCLYPHIWVQVDLFNFSNVSERSWFTISKTPGMIKQGHVPLRYTSSIVNIPLVVIKNVKEGDHIKLTMPMEYRLKNRHSDSGWAYSKNGIMEVDAEVSQLKSRYANLGTFESALSNLI